MRSVARRHATDSQAGAGKVPFFEACLLASDQPIPLGTPVVHRTARALSTHPRFTSTPILSYLCPSSKLGRRASVGGEQAMPESE